MPSSRCGETLPTAANAANHLQGTTFARSRMPGLSGQGKYSLQILSPWWGTSPQAASRPAPLKGEPPQTQGTLWRPLRGDSPRGGEMSRSDRGDGALFALSPQVTEGWFLATNLKTIHRTLRLSPYTFYHHKKHMPAHSASGICFFFYHCIKLKFHSPCAAG